MSTKKSATNPRRKIIHDRHFIALPVEGGYIQCMCVHLHILIYKLETLIDGLPDEAAAYAERILEPNNNRLNDQAITFFDIVSELSILEIFRIVFTIGGIEYQIQKSKTGLNLKILFDGGKIAITTSAAHIYTFSHCTRRIYSQIVSACKSLIIDNLTHEKIKTWID